VARTIAVLDTGFNGALALPSGLIQALKLARKGDITVRLASGEERLISTYRATVLFGGAPPRPVTVVEAGETLVGAALLWDLRVCLHYAEGGRVEIETLA
jgi:predicted aspartyl protease